MLTDSPTGIVNVQPILEAIWLFLLGSCRRLANAVPSPSISSGFDPDIGSADICPRCPVPSVSCAREFREREDYISYAEHELRFFYVHCVGCSLTRRGRALQGFASSALLHNTAARPILPRFFVSKCRNLDELRRKTCIFEKKVVILQSFSRRYTHYGNQTI